MSNELVLLLSLAVIYAGTLFFYRQLGSAGLYAWTAIATITANIEVLILVDAFGMEQTLGNILFASTFLVTDLLSELEGKEAANKAVKIGIFTSIAMILISQSWFLYTPNANDWVFDSVATIFSNTPRLMLAGVVTYALVQVFDVWFYHFIWAKTTAKWGDSHKGLWLRNNGSTLVSQLINAIVFNLGAFYGVYDLSTLGYIIVATYVVFVVTSLLDTPVVYLARKMQAK